jgi:integrase
MAKAGAKSAPKTSFDYLIDEYLASAEYRALSDATQLDYGKTCDILKDKLGKWPYALTTRNMIKAVRDSFASTPRKAHKIKQMVSCLYSWADDNDLVPAGFNPAKDLKKLKRKGGAKEYTVWSEAEFQTFFAGAIRPMQTAAMLARYTGQRVQDVGKATWQDFQGTEIRVRQAKTGAPLIIACHSKLRNYLNDLKRELDAEKKRGVMILTSLSGKAYDGNSLSSAVYREVQRIDGMPKDRSLHGLRYMAGSDMEEAGCTVAEIESVLGHQTFKMALKYASQRLRAKAAAEKRENNA